MTTKFTIKNTALMSVVAQRIEPTLVQCSVTARLPGVDLSEAMFHIEAGEAIWESGPMCDFHNEWKAWGNLVECVIQDWTRVQGRLL